jgi:hypothetical protein
MMSFIDGDEYDARTRAASARITGSDQASAAQGEIDATKEDGSRRRAGSTVGARRDRGKRKADPK